MKVLYEKDTTGLYALKKLAKRGKSFTVAILFDKVHEYSKRYEFACNDAVTAILSSLVFIVLAFINQEPIKQFVKL